MNRLTIATTMTAISTAAVAHPSVVDHAHPHESFAGALLGLDTLALAALALIGIGVARVVLKRIRK